MPSRVEDWLRQADRDLEAALTTAGAGQFDWSCFAGHQASNKALKALYQHHNAKGWGHVLYRLVDGLVESEPGLADLRDTARILDKYYIPTRYPNGLDAGAPADAYTKAEADAALRDAQAIVQFCKTRCRPA